MAGRDAEAALIVANPRTKGASGEREVAKILNGIIVDVMRDKGYPEDQMEAAQTSVQRNQNQSAVGGCDLTNTFGMAFEVKRQERLSVPSWWRQTVDAADRNGDLPVLIYRQNRRPWVVRTYAWLPLPGAAPGSWNRQRRVVSEFSLDEFREWFKLWVGYKLEQGEEVKT